MRIEANIIFPKPGGGRFSAKRIITSRAELQKALEDLCIYNLAFLAMDPSLPDVYDAELVYKPEPPGQEDWLTYPVLIAQGYGDCEDLACARVAKLRSRGENAVPYLYNKGRLWHVMLKREDGSIEDPSAAMGMYNYDPSEVGL